VELYNFILINGSSGNDCLVECANGGSDYSVECANG
jgi:hypothetical protein